MSEKIEIAKLKAGTKLWVETVNNIYEIQLVDEDGTAMIVCPVRFSEPTESLIIGSGGEKGFIVRDKGLEFAYSTDEGIKHIRTSPIKKCGLVGVNEEWEYEVWDESTDTA